MAKRPSKGLFQTASAAVRRYARRKFQRSPAGRLLSQAKKYASNKQSMRRLAYDMQTPEARNLLRELKRAGATVTKHSKLSDGRAALDKILGFLGPLGQVIRSIVGTGGAQTMPEDQFDTAAELVRAFGGEVLTKPGQKGHQRGVDAARELLDQLGMGTGSHEGGEAQGPEEWPEEHMIQTTGRGPIGWDEVATRELVEREVVVSSSNVYSFVFFKETKRSGILYVTFLAWHPGIERRSGPGSTYAYYDVPLRKYHQFKNATSTGKAVWDYLRVRGSLHDHQHPYRLVAGSVIPSGGVYVPRKSTGIGLRGRAVPQHGVGRRGFQRNTLPERIRASPNRGEPNRGAPNRG